jgi:hypothetical protein
MRLRSTAQSPHGGRQHHVLATNANTFPAHPIQLLVYQTELVFFVSNAICISVYKKKRNLFFFFFKQVLV